MPAVLVHGVPNTHRVWDRVRAQLSRKDVVALALPGFDNPAPAGFTSTKEAYADWIIQQLETIGTPVDLVGHDWGGMFTARVASIPSGSCAHLDRHQRPDRPRLRMV